MRDVGLFGGAITQDFEICYSHFRLRKIRAFSSSFSHPSSFSSTPKGPTDRNGEVDPIFRGISLFKIYGVFYPILEVSGCDWEFNGGESTFINDTTIRATCKLILLRAFAAILLLGGLGVNAFAQHFFWGGCASTVIILPKLII